MEFTLKYLGELKSKGRIRHKQDIRRQFHIQLKELWNQPPLVHRHRMLKDKPRRGTSIIFPVSPFRFAPFVNSRLDLVAELDVTLLRPEPPGNIVTQGGDIDNRLKTLFDSLKVPENNAIPKGDAPKSDEDPFFCVLEDDNLIVKLSVSTDRLLDPNAGLSDVLLLVRVTTKTIVATWENVGL